MAALSGLERTRRHFDWYGKDIGVCCTRAMGGFISKCFSSINPEDCHFYEKDTAGARTFRAVAATITGIVKVPLFPVACALGLVGMPLFGCGRACYHRDAKEFDSPCVAAMICLVGLIATATFAGASAYGGLTLNQSVGIFLGAIATSVTANVYSALQNHAVDPVAGDTLIQ